MKAFLFYLSTLVLGLWLQLVVNHMLGGSWFSLQLVMVAVIYWGLNHGPVSGLMMGFGWGLMVDASSLGLLGLHGLLWAGVGYSAGGLRRQLDEDKPWTQAIFTFVLSLVYSVILFALDRIFVSGDRTIQPESLLQPLWNALAAPFLFVALGAWERIWDIHPRTH